MAVKMRTMTHHGRGKGKGGMAYGSKHDDRNFDITKSENIAPELTPKNLVWHIYQDAKAPRAEEKPEAAAAIYAPLNWRLQADIDAALATQYAAEDKARFFAEREKRALPEPGPDMTFDEVELRFYLDHFSEQLEETNAKYRANGHPERCKSMDAWKKSRRNAPAESIHQIGDMHITGVYADAQTLQACFEEFELEERRWNAEHGHPFTMLNCSLHVDEPSCPPHVHSRRVWHYRAEDGTLRLGQEKALAQAGIELPDPSKAPGRRNNRKMVYDAMMRDKWLDILERHGIQVEREPAPENKGKPSMDREQYVREKFEQMRLQADAEAERAAREKEAADAAAAKLANSVRQLHGLQEQADSYRAANKEKLEIISYNEAIIQEQEVTLELIADYEEYCTVADTTDSDLELGERMIDRLPPPGIFRPAEEKDWLRDIKTLLQRLLYSIGESIRRLRIFEVRNDLSPRRSEPAQARATALRDKIADAEVRHGEGAAERRQGRRKGPEQENGNIKA